jgi:hypothetical protein
MSEVEMNWQGRWDVVCTEKISALCTSTIICTIMGGAEVCSNSNIMFGSREPPRIVDYYKYCIRVLYVLVPVVLYCTSNVLDR